MRVVTIVGARRSVAALGQRADISPGFGKQICLLIVLLLFNLANPPTVLAQNSSGPALSVQTSPDRQLQISWPSSASGLALEQTDALSSLTQWRPVSQVPGLQANQYVVTLSASALQGFFRLRDAPSTLTTIAESSPLSGEQGVAVTRETIIWLSAPLASNTVVNTANLHAEAGGRQVLSRVELSSDRARATLFYLEPLPASARVNVTFNGTGLTDALGRPVDLDGDGQAGGQALIAFDTLSIAPLAGTAIRGRVFASELVPASGAGAATANRPLENVTITVDGMEETLRTTTDSQGNFVLDPCPAGEFFVKIDGRTARGSQWPDGDYYPFVGKSWVAVPGVKDNLAGGSGEIFLPLIKAGTLQPVSLTTDTVVALPASTIASNPALAGVTITVPANALFADDGSRGGKVGLAPVPPDRLPGPLPPGLEMPIVITVQTDGPLNFDQPAPVCFPNLPDPVLGVPLPPGSKQSLISFNHDKGVWEGVGSMTVSADGKLICTDPQVGILQPGWHGVGPPPDGPPPPPCDPPGPAPASLPSSVGAALLSRSRPVEPVPGCHDACVNKFQKCIEDARNKFTFGSLHCYNTNKNSAAASDCAKQRFLDYETDKVFCRIDLDFCEEKCKPPPPPPPPPPKPPKPPKPKPKKPATCRPPKKPVSRAALQSLPLNFRIEQENVLQQLDVIFGQIEALAGPYAGSAASWPAAVSVQIQRLFDQANSVAGGDAGLFLHDHLLQLEMEAAANGTLDEPDGNAPEDPVLYVAQVLRPGGMFELRGKTEPYGQYSLFVPRDGTLLSVRFYDPETKSFAVVFPRLRPDAPWRLPSFTLAPLDPAAPDADQDGLPDAVESVYGTDPFNPDTGNKGITDGAAVEMGLDPLGGFAAQTGIIAQSPTPGRALDVCAFGGVAIVGGTAGVSVFGLAENAPPTLAAHVATTSVVQRVACTGAFIAAAQGTDGLAVIDGTDLNAATVLYQLRLGDVRAVQTDGRIGYAGLQNGQVLKIDLPTGTVLDQVNITNPVVDVAVSGAFIFILDAGRLHAIEDGPEGLVWSASALSPYPAAPNRRLTVAGGLAYAVHAKGYNTFDLANPAAPALIQASDTRQFGWTQVVPNGSGLGLAVVGPNAGENDPHDVALYDLTDPKQTDVFLTAFPMPGIARAVAIQYGKAHVAADTAGLVVVNYLGYDSKRVAPTVAVAHNAPATGVEEGALISAVARATDDVQVRAVEFYLDGVLADSAGHFPFEGRLVAPSLRPDKASFRLQARALDTGGNVTWSTESVIALLPDATQPRLIGSYPPNRAVVETATFVRFLFSEPVQAPAGALQVLYAGPDHRFGTADDQPLLAAGQSSEPELNAVRLQFRAPLPVGQFRLSAASTVVDYRGNALASGASTTFWILAGGLEGDADDDELPNFQEPDYGTDPILADTDGDGWIDGLEVANGSDPLNPQSVPPGLVISRPSASVHLAVPDGIPGEKALVLAQPAVSVEIKAADQPAGELRGVTVALPPVVVTAKSADEPTPNGAAVLVAKPPVTVKRAAAP